MALWRLMLAEERSRRGQHQQGDARMIKAVLLHKQIPGVEEDRDFGAAFASKRLCAA